MGLPSEGALNFREENTVKCSAPEALVSARWSRRPKRIEMRKWRRTREALNAAKVASENVVAPQEMYTPTRKKHSATQTTLRMQELQHEK